MTTNGAHSHSNGSLSIPPRSSLDSTAYGSTTVVPTVASSSWASESAVNGDPGDLQVRLSGTSNRLKFIEVQLQTLTDQLNHEFLIKEGAEDMLRKQIPVSLMDICVEFCGYYPCVGVSSHRSGAGAFYRSEEDCVSETDDGSM